MWEWNKRVATSQLHGLTLAVEDHGGIWSWRVRRCDTDIDEGMEESLAAAFAASEAAAHKAAVIADLDQRFFARLRAAGAAWTPPQSIRDMQASSMTGE